MQHSKGQYSSTPLFSPLCGFLNVIAFRVRCCAPCLRGVRACVCLLVGGWVGGPLSLPLSLFSYTTTGDAALLGGPGFEAGGKTDTGGYTAPSLEAGQGADAAGGIEYARVRCVHSFVRSFVRSFVH